MHLLHRSSVFGAGGANNKRALRRVGSSPRAPPRLMSKSESIKKRGGVKHGSKRARLRAGLAAALQELRLAGRGKRGGGTRPGVQAGGPSDSCSDAATEAEGAAAGPEEPTAIGGGVTGGALLPLLLLVLALASVVALGRAPAVCCCTCAAWWCRGSSQASSAAAKCDHKLAPVLAARQRR